MKLHPDLKRLLILSGQGPPPPEAAPFGFAARVVAAWTPARKPTLLFELQRVAWSSAFVSLVVILCGVVVLLSQADAPEPATGLSSAVRFLVSNIIQ